MHPSSVKMLVFLNPSFLVMLNFMIIIIKDNCKHVNGINIKLNYIIKIMGRIILKEKYWLVNLK